VYRQYDHEVGVRTAMKPGDDAAIMAIRETASTDAGDLAPADQGVGLALLRRKPELDRDRPYEGARAVAFENATNLAAKGAVPLAAVDCLNGGNPEKPEVYGGFKGIVDGLADACADLDAPVVGGNVSLYNDSVEGPIPPTPTLALIGTRKGYDAPPAALDADRAGDSELLLSRRRRRRRRRARRLRVPRAGRRNRPVPGAAGHGDQEPRRPYRVARGGRPPRIDARDPRRERRRARGRAGGTGDR